MVYSLHEDYKGTILVIGMLQPMETSAESRFREVHIEAWLQGRVYIG